MNIYVTGNIDTDKQVISYLDLDSIITYASLNKTTYNMNIVKQLYHPIAEYRRNVRIHGYDFLLRRSIVYDHPTLANRLIEQGTYRYEYPILIVLATNYDRIEIIKSIVNSGYMLDPYGEALYNAIFYNNYDIVRYLVENGTKITNKILSSAIELASKQIFEFLLDKCVENKFDVGTTDVVKIDRVFTNIIYAPRLDLVKCFVERIALEENTKIDMLIHSAKVFHDKEATGDPIAINEAKQMTHLLISYGFPLDAILQSANKFNSRAIEFLREFQNEFLQEAQKID